MEFAFDVRGVLPDAVTRVSKDQLPGLRNNQSRDERSQQLATIVNKLGAASAKAQGLRVAVTTYQKLMASSHTLYLLRDDCEQPVVVGLLKVGRKKLFLQDLLGVQRETEPLCVLDFYIHEARQRAGLGRRLFQTMLDIERVTAAELAIDRPSTKFLSFLRKHYGLHFHVKQGNNFVVFSQFFQNYNSFSRPNSKLTSNLESSKEQKKIEMVQNRVVEDSPKLPSTEEPLTTRGKSQRQWILPPSTHDDNNVNWSPETVLLRSRQHLRPVPCDIITGAPLPTRERPPQACHRGERAPLLTMREKRFLKGGSRLGFGGPFSKLSQTATPQGCRLAGQGLRPRDSIYSRHSLGSIQPSSHALIPPDHNPDDRSSSNRND